MAMGSRRTTPTAPVAAAVVSDARVAPRNVPWSQSNAWYARGTSFWRRAPKRMALMGTPLGLSHSGDRDGHSLAGTVKRLLGWATGPSREAFHGRPRQSATVLGVGSSCPSHHTPPSGLSPTLVKIVFLRMVRMALGLVLELVPGTTPKKPASGLTAHRRPSSPTRSHAMSSPTVNTRQPSMDPGGTSMARLVLPQALGSAPHT